MIENKMFIVILVQAAIFLGIFSYLLFLHNKTRNLKKRIDNQEK